ncbi:MerR family transcriptional regulator [Ruegeria atlantica]|uniref:MerR family transcriptional regulator n=1 Tax=Ruegeria atlantica TaxID=81569 RepID=A0AA90YWY0_9RHOB|nr:MerR family transcriptional regulator [Ruegeria atlantica]NOE20813.1 MerR family transcriptional regulator [Ruegeria atlantica]
MKIGKLAEITGVSTSSIRFYEKHGLIPATHRRENGYRDYPETMVSRIRTIAVSKSLGFSLSEIRRFLPDDPTDQIERADVISNLEQKLGDVDQKMRDLLEIRKKLTEMITYMKDPERSGC